MTSSPELVLAVDIGGTKVDAALVTASGEVLRDTVARRPTGRASSREDIATSIRDAAAAAFAKVPAGARVGGVGVGSAGPIDRPSRSVNPINLPTAHGLVPADVLREVVGDLPVALALDGTCIVLGEHWLGALQGTSTALAMVVSTGVGGGFIVDGRPVTGASGNAGHIGQIRVRTRDDTDPIASTLEAVAAGPHTVAWARSQGWTGATGEELAEAYRSGDEIAVRAVARSAEAVGEAISTAATLFDLEAVALAGGFIAVADDYIERVAASARASAVNAYAAEVRVLRSTLHGDGPLLGAAALALRASPRRNPLVPASARR